MMATSTTESVHRTCKARSVRRLVVNLLTGCLVLAGIPACGSSPQRACGPITRDALDPGSLTHVLPGAPPPSYLTDPPTSGAHQPTPMIHGVQRRPIAPQIQVGILEEGRVLVQYHGVSTKDVARLRTLSSHEVVVAPAASLPGNTRVVATAWVTRQECSAVDLGQLRHFVDTRARSGPGHS